MIITAVAAAAASDPLDEKSLAMAKRIIQKVKDQPNPPPSWNMILQVMENSFLAIPDKTSDFYQSSPHEEEARQSALHWLAHEDDGSSSTNISDESYDRGLLQRYALTTIYFATGGDDHWNRCSREKKDPSSAGNANNSICESDDERYLSPTSHLRWDGINGKNEQITWLDLSGRGLRSNTFLPLEVTLLSPSLELFWVSENAGLEGILPNYLDEFQSLVSLSVYKTSVSGSVPESIFSGCTKLNSIRLYKSKFEGTVSSQIGKLVDLKWLWIHENDFTGRVPTEVGQLVKLEGVTLHGNRFDPVIHVDENHRSGGVGLNNIVPPSLCSLKGEILKHLWTDCEEGALTPAFSDEEGEGNTRGIVVNEGVQACVCCTRCFPRKNDGVVVPDK